MSFLIPAAYAQEAAAGLLVLVSSGFFWSVFWSSST